jgi:hypothetical protein
MRLSAFPTRIFFLFTTCCARGKGIPTRSFGTIFFLFGCYDKTCIGKQGEKNRLEERASKYSSAAETKSLKFKYYKMCGFSVFTRHAEFTLPH